MNESKAEVLNTEGQPSGFLERFFKLKAHGTLSLIHI